MTDYISNIKVNNVAYSIGGNNFDGDWIGSNFTIVSDSTLSGNSCTPYSLSSYLPDDGYDYEVMFWGGSTSQATSGRLCAVTLLSGSTTAATGFRLGMCNARTAATVFCGGSAIIPIFASSKYVSVYIQGSSYNNTGVWVKATGYRRIGTND